MLAPFATRHATNGMVCSVDHLASEAGVAVMRTGGSAADAAIATSAVLAVTTQHMCGMGGDLFALVHDRVGAAPDALDAAGRAGSGVDAAAMRAEGLRTMPFHDDVRSVPVPGCVDGWLTLHERHGRAPIDAVLAPAIALARRGFPASPTLAAAVARLPDISATADLRQVTKAGDLVQRPAVADALAAIASDGRDGFYRGEFGFGLVELAAGIITPDDLARQQAQWVEPLGLAAWGHTIWSTPPPSQGYLTLASAWIAAGLELPADPSDERWPHLLIEAARVSGFDRIDVLHEHADGTELVDLDRLAARRSLIRHDAAARLPGTFASGGTIYLCAADQEMGVSLIQSNAAGFGSGLWEPRTRIALQNRGIGFSLIDGHPAEAGPGRRPPHTLAPALVTRGDGSLHAVLGSMGGDSQPQIVLQLLARLLLANQTPADVVAAPRWRLSGHTGTGFDTWAGRGTVRVLLEGGAPESWEAGLRARGHETATGPPFDHGAGHAHVILRQPDGVLAGAADPRPRTGAAAGW